VYARNVSWGLYVSPVTAALLVGLKRDADVGGTLSLVCLLLITGYSLVIPPGRPTSLESETTGTMGRLVIPLISVVPVISVISVVWLSVMHLRP
jgi:hypothetical protein